MPSTAAATSKRQVAAAASAAVTAAGRCLLRSQVAGSGIWGRQVLVVGAVVVAASPV